MAKSAFVILLFLGLRVAESFLYKTVIVQKLIISFYVVTIKHLRCGQSLSLQSLKSSAEFVGVLTWVPHPQVLEHSPQLPLAEIINVKN